MDKKRGLPTQIYFQTRIFSFYISWDSPSLLTLQSIKKQQPTKCFKGQIRGEDKQTGLFIQKLYEYLQNKLAMTNFNKTDLLTPIITIIDMSQQHRGYACRVLFEEEVKTINVQLFIVSQSYFISKKLEIIDQQKISDRLMFFQIERELSKKIEEKDLSMKYAFRQSMEDLVNTLKKRIQMEFEEKSRILNNQILKKIPQQQQLTASDSTGSKQFQKKLRKKIKKQLKDKKKKHKKDSKKKKKKSKKKRGKEQKGKDQRLQNNGEMILNLNNETNPVPIQLLMGDRQFKQQLQENIVLNEMQNYFDLMNINQNENVVQNPQSKKKKKKKDKHRYRQLLEAQHANKLPAQTSLNSMGKLRNRAQQIERQGEIPQNQYIIDVDPFQNYMLKKQKKKDKKKHKNGTEVQIQPIELQENQQQQLRQRQYYRRLEQLRKKGDIEQVRITKLDKKRLLPVQNKPVLTEEDEFNPKYNGVPRYKSFVNINDKAHRRPGEIFGQRLQQIGSQCKRIPVVFRQQIPSFKYFQISGNVVKKVDGMNYKQIVFDYSIPRSGKHTLVMRIIESKRFYMWMGVIDIRQKDREESYNKKNSITFSFRTGHIASNNKWSKSKIGMVEKDTSVRMEVDMDKNAIVWYLSDGRNNIATIPKLIRKLTLVPYFEMMDINDQVLFQQ